MLRSKTPAHRPSILTLMTLTLLLIAGPRSSAVAQDETAPGAEAGHTPAAGEEAHGGGAEAAHGGDDVNILAPQPTLAVYTLVVFLILLAVLWRFAWGPLSKALHDREHTLETAFQDAEKARAEAASLLEQHRKQMEQVQDQVRQIMEEANRKAQAAYQERLDQARADAEATAQRASREIAGAKEQALTEIYEKSADLAVTVAGRILQREIGVDEQRRLIDVASLELQAVGPDGRGGIS
ncbi:F0F1 ATP synthase subunit B [Tautonia plasticadhaerens]|uniref:ATP synthase subunit b n=1 Tax=Tautonia plasticadhaerens TaxID=2527974 RepID=A0A518H862_9BACT|nr:F0F1 ATP synthase subunit B [Tautonia plasticadhaerens]QDV37040.1 ATP synthase subunit b [Tautonia plasticadhaerens]